MTRTGLFRYVPWDSIDEFHRNGWMIVADLGPTHGTYCVLAWHCDCPDAPSLPNQARAA